MTIKGPFLAAVIAYLAGLVGLGIGRFVLNLGPMFQFIAALTAAVAVFFLVERRFVGRRKQVASRSGRSRIFNSVVLFVLIIATQWIQLHYPDSWPAVVIVALLPVLLLSQVLIGWWEGDWLAEGTP